MKPLIIAHYFFLILAMVLFALAGWGTPEPTHNRFIGWGLFCFVLSMLLV